MGPEGTDTQGLDSATVELVDSLHALTQQIVDASKNYKDKSGQEGLLQRQRMTNAARQIINTVREPGETPYEFSTHVEWIHACAAEFGTDSTLDGGNGCNSHVHENQGI
jgi:hypothetical protein